jgi:hypothetical protein
MCCFIAVCDPENTFYIFQRAITYTAIYMPTSKRHFMPEISQKKVNFFHSVKFSHTPVASKLALIHAFYTTIVFQQKLSRSCDFFL